MIFKIKKYFRGKTKKYYQDELINKLNKEHQKLFSLVGKMDEVAEKKDIKKLKKLIEIFKKELELHVLYEDTNLYEHLYLRYHYYPDVKSEIKQKHDEIKDIAVAVQKFIETHQDLNSLTKFKEDFEVIKQVLVKRVSFEEEILYDIYMTNQNVNNIVLKLKTFK